MIKKILTLLLAALVSLGLSSCGYGLYKVLGHGDSVEEREGELSDIAASAVAGSSYSFLLITDVHFGSSKGRNDDKFLQKLNEMNKKPSFGICLGDIADHGRDSEFKDYNSFVAKIEGIIGGKVYSIVGNHDLYNDGWDGFSKYVYPNNSFYRFQINNISYYFLDSGSGSLGKTQFDRFKRAMLADPNRKIVCNHYPAYGTDDFFASYYSLQNTLEADQLLTLLKNSGTVAYFSGHMHANHVNDLETFKEYVVPSYLSNGMYAIVTVNSDGSVSSYQTQSY